MLYIYNDSTNAYYNMAAEEYILRNFPKPQEALFMLWRNEPAIIVGRNQNTLAEINYGYVSEHNIPVVRRLSGGGAVFHDLGNINYTFVEPGSGHSSDFAYFSKPILAALAKLGIDANLKGRNDLVIGEKKFSGTAQSVYNDRMMHHGTLLFSSNITALTAALNVRPGKIKSKGIRSISSRVTNISDHLPGPMPVEDFLKHIEKEVCAQARSYSFTAEDEAAIQKLCDEKYTTWGWNYGDSPHYTVSAETTLASGHVELYLDVVHGVIKSVKILGDFFGSGEIAELESALSGTPHQPDAVENVLREKEVSHYIWGADAKLITQAIFC